MITLHVNPVMLIVIPILVLLHSFGCYSSGYRKGVDDAWKSIQGEDA